MSQQWYKNCSGILLVFSVTDRNSFSHIQRWIDDISRNSTDFVLFLVGNKTDLKNDRVVSFEEGEELAKRLQVKYIETSIFIDKIPNYGFKIHNIIEDLAREINRKD